MGTVRISALGCRRHLFILLCICFAAVILGDSTAEALLLAHFGADLLPRMFFFNAAALFIASACIMSLIDRVDRGALFFWGLCGHAAVLLSVRLATLFDSTWLFLPLFTYAYVTKVLFFLLFWTLANDCIDSRSAQKHFPFIAAGGTLGAITIAFAISLLVRYSGAVNLLFVWSGLVMLCALAFVPLRARAGRIFIPSSDRKRHRPRSLRATLGEVRIFSHDPLLGAMAAIYGTVFFLLIIQQYFFYVEIKQQFVTPEGIAGFLGVFNGISMVATMLIQLSVAGTLLRRFGTSRAMLFLPGAFLLIFLALAMVSGAGPSAATLLFGVIVAGMGLRIAVFDSFFSPNFQLFFSSMPQELRGRAKLALEGVVKPCAILAASLWLMFAAFSLSFTMVMLVSAAVSGALLYLTWRLKGKYAESLVRFLAGVSGSGRISALAKNARSASFIDQVRAILEHGDYEIQKFVLEEIAVSGSPDLRKLIEQQVRHTDGRVRATAVAVLGTMPCREMRPLLESCLDDEDERVVANAVAAVGHFADSAAATLIEKYVSHPCGRVRANAATALWRHSGYGRKSVLLRRLEEMLDTKTPAECASALFALGEIEGEESLRLLLRFLETSGHDRIGDTGPVFRQLAAALARKPCSEALGGLLDMARDTGRLQKREIVHAVSSMAAGGLSQEMIASLMRKEYPLHNNILVRALHESGTKASTELGRAVRRVVAHEIDESARDITALASLEPFRMLHGIDLLCYVILEESVALRNETMAFALSLFEPGGAIRAVAARLFHHDPHVRARAFEVLDTTGDLSLNRSVMRALERAAAPSAARSSGDAPARPETCIDAIRPYCSHVNTWITRCAVFARDQVLAHSSQPCNLSGAS
ncbi:MAG: HEAT repeat domain-containing protein [Chitinispirillaceae bacterium]|nr:HEAT repeat domain-containing protein [Chitinispirillaceae bacterium]